MANRVRPADGDDNSEDQAVIDMDDALAGTSITPVRQVVTVERCAVEIDKLDVLAVPGRRRGPREERPVRGGTSGPGEGRTAGLILE